MHWQAIHCNYCLSHPLKLISMNPMSIILWFYVRRWSNSSLMWRYWYMYLLANGPMIFLPAMLKWSTKLPKGCTCCVHRLMLKDVASDLSRLKATKAHEFFGWHLCLRKGISRHHWCMFNHVCTYLLMSLNASCDRGWLQSRRMCLIYRKHCNSWMSGTSMQTEAS